MQRNEIQNEPQTWVASEALPWIPLGPGKAFKPLMFLPENTGFVELLRLEPGQEIAWHRHTGCVHAINLSGSRELHTGEQIGPLDYVYEPAGNVDRWKVLGTEPLILFVVVYGQVEYLDDAGKVTAVFTAERLKEVAAGKVHS
ncbi:MAG: anti-sigma factor [Acidobacteria bacterium]|nr:anti-sigma factor [Acidobacteriota bacterium]MCB9396516.1 anti-sigma factor [Acidobacteriota bacterium]